MRLFRPRPFLDDELSSWQIETYAWLLRNLGGFEQFRCTSLITPSADFFPREGLSGDALAGSLFVKVRHYAGMDEWPCELVAQVSDPETQVGLFHSVQQVEATPAGTFSLSPGQKDFATITYNPALSGDPMNLIATFAHELCHYLLATIREEPPGGWDVHEFSTDLAAVFLGFGIFMINTSFRFGQFGDTFGQGWRTQSSGYLSQRELIFATALFVALRLCATDDVLKYLKSWHGRDFKKAMKDIGRRPEIIARLFTIEQRSDD